MTTIHELCICLDMCICRYVYVCIHLFKENEFLIKNTCKKITCLESITGNNNTNSKASGKIFSKLFCKVSTSLIPNQINKLKEKNFRPISNTKCDVVKIIANFQTYKMDNYHGCTCSLLEKIPAC